MLLLRPVLMTMRNELATPIYSHAITENKSQRNKVELCFRDRPTASRRRQEVAARARNTKRFVSKK